MQTTPKTNKTVRQFFALLAGGAALAIATLVTASTSKQVEQLSSLAVPRTGHAATALSDGRVLITGGHDSAGNLVAVSEIFDPATGNSTASATLTTARVNHTATRLADGRVLVAGGTGASGALSSAEIFDPANASAGFQAAGSAMTAARTGHTATLLNNGSVLIAGGEATGTVEIFDPTSNTFTATTGNLTVARSGHSATLFTDDSVLLAGGNVNSLETFTPTDQKFTLDAAAMSVVRTGHWALELSGTRLLLFQGDTNNTIEEYNPTAGTITSKGSLDFHASSSTLLANGKVLVIGSGVAGLYDPDAVPPASDFTAFNETSVPGSTALQRSGQSATQLSGDKKIYVAGGANAQNLLQGAALFNPARIWTDKDDYQPGDNVILSGSGWKANEDVYLYAIDDTTQAWTYGSTATADANGGFVVDPYFVVQLVQDGANFTVSAVGAQSAMQAEVKFTDATFNSLTVGSQTGTATAGTAANVTYNVAANFNGNNTANTVTFSFAWNGTPPSGVTVDPFNPTSVSAPPIGTKNSTLAIHTVGGTPAGTYSFTVTGTPTSGSTRSDTGTLVVGQAPAFTSPDNTTFTVLSPGTFNVTATGVPAPTFSFTGSLPSGVNLSSAGVLSGTPASGTAGDYTITITASNGIGSPATQLFTLHVDKIQPTFSSLTPSQTITRGTASISVGGRLNAGSGSVPTGTATVTVDGAPVATTSTFNGNLGNFTATVNTSAILASAVPYTITYSYLGDANYKSASDSSTTLTVNNPAPTLASINPTSGNLGQTLNVTFTGTNYFSGVTTVSFGANITVNTITVNNSTSLTANITIGAGAATGPRNVSVTNPTPGGGTATLTNGFTVNNPTVSTTTTVTSSLNPSIYGDNVTFTATVTAASGTTNPTGTVTFTIDGNAGGPINLSDCSPNVPGMACASTSTSSLSHNNGVAHTVSAAYTHTGSFVDSSGSLSPSQTVNRKSLTAQIINDPTKPYDGNMNAALTSADFDLTGLVGSDDFTVTKTTGTYNTKDVATANTITTSLAASDFTPVGSTLADNYNLPTTASGPGHITPKTGVTASIIGNPTRPYNCGTVAALTSANFQLSGLVGSENFTVNQTVGAYNSKDVASANMVTATLSASDFTGTNGGITSNYVLPTSASGAGHITPVDATISVTAYTSATTTYDCNYHFASGTATGCDGDLSALFDFSGTKHKNAGTYNNDPWTFNAGSTNPNYNSTSGTVNDSIAKADPTINVTRYNVTFNCNAHTATGTATGCDGNLLLLGDTLDLSGTTHTDAGDYTGDSWSFTDVTGNYNNKTGTVHDVISKANTTASVTSTPNPSFVAQPVTFTATVAGTPPVTCVPTGTVTFKDGTTTIGTGPLNVSGQATFTTSSLSAGSHSITAVYGGDSNFNGSTGPSPAYVQSVQYIFIGFLPPIDNLPYVNSSKAGQTIPVKWQLKDYNGNLISDLGTLPPNGLQSIKIACDTHDPQDSIEELAPTGSTVFRFDGTQFIYNWQTQKSWAPSCRQLQVTLTDGTTHIANFTFLK